MTPPWYRSRYQSPFDSGFRRGLDLAAEVGADADADEGYDLVTGRMQDALGELAEARAFPLIG